MLGRVKSLRDASAYHILVLRLGATHHVSGEQSAFSSISQTSGSQVRSAGGHSHSVAGIGNVELQFSNGEIKSIGSVLYTPGITKNLLSVGALTDQNKTLVFRSEGCFIINNSNLAVEALALRENNHGLYRLSGSHRSRDPEVNLLHHSQAELWHKRLGHFHTKGIQRMANYEAVKGLPQLHFSRQTCTGCQLGKHARTKMPKETKFHASKILQLVHSDVCGPFRTNSLGGAQYFVTFIDNFSKKIWIYFLANKSQVLSKFQHLVNLLETSTGRRIQALRTDNGGEYTSANFRDYCLAKGIAREFTPPYTPQCNGIAERRNRSLLDITRCLLMDRALPGHLWGEAVKAAGDILNLRSTKRHPDKTPEELFSGKKPSISHLKVFGSPVFVHSTKPSRSKLDPRSEKCILLGFDTEAKAYRCYRPSTKRVFISRDVTVDETSSNAPMPNSELREDDPPIISAASPRKEEQATFSDQTSLPTPDASAQTPDPVYAPLDNPTSPTGSDAID